MNEQQARSLAQANLNKAIDHFVSRLEVSHRVARAPGASGGTAARRDLAELRRGTHGYAICGRGREAPLHRYVAPSLNLLPEPQQDRIAVWFYTVGSLFALHPRSMRKNSETDKEPVFGWTTFGKTCGKLCARSPSLEGRFIALLSSDAAEVPVHLRQIVNILRSQQTPVFVNWRLMLADLTQWNSDSGFVQRKWGRHFYREMTPSNKRTKSQSNDAPNALPDEIAE